MVPLAHGKRLVARDRRRAAGGGARLRAQRAPRAARRVLARRCCPFLADVAEPLAETPVRRAARAGDRSVTSIPRALKILIVEDSPAMRQLLAMAVKRRGADVAEAPDGLAALKLLAQRARSI